MKIHNPQQHNMSTPQGMLRWAQSVYKAVTSGISPAQPVSTDASGTYNTFVPDNGNGVMIRVGANGDTSNPITWSSSGTVIINHGLQRQPIGFHIADSSGAAMVYRTTTATNNTISLATSNDAVANTFWIF